MTPNKLLWFLGVASLLVYLQMLTLLVTGTGQIMATLDTDLSWRVSTSLAFLNTHTGSNNIDNYLSLNAIDSIFPFFYAPFLYTLIKTNTNTQSPLLLALPILSGLLDILENIAIRHILTAYPRPVSTTTLHTLYGHAHWLTLGKTLCLVLTLCHVGLWLFGCGKNKGGDASRTPLRSKKQTLVGALSLMTVLISCATPATANNHLLDQQKQAWNTLNQLYSSWSWSSSSLPSTTSRARADPSTTDQKHQQGTVTWNFNNYTRKSNFFYLPSLLTHKETQTLKSMLPTSFDEDLDSVDDAPTYEFYLEKNGDYDQG